MFNKKCNCKLELETINSKLDNLTNLFMKEVNPEVPQVPVKKKQQVSEHHPDVPKIMELLKGSYYALSPIDVAEQLQISYSHASRLLKKLSENGSVKRRRRGGGFVYKEAK